MTESIAQGQSPWLAGTRSWERERGVGQGRLKGLADSVRRKGKTERLPTMQVLRNCPDGQEMQRKDKARHV